jgi:hypothetical protein
MQRELNQSNDPVAVKQEIVAPVNFEKRFIGTLHPYPGQKLFKLDLKTLIVTVVNKDEYKQNIVMKAVDGKLAPEATKKELLVEVPTHWYEVAATKKAAIKKFGERLKRVLGDPKVTTVDDNS